MALGDYAHSGQFVTLGEITIRQKPLRRRYLTRLQTQATEFPIRGSNNAAPLKSSRRRHYLRPTSLHSVQLVDTRCRRLSRIYYIRASLLGLVGVWQAPPFDIAHKGIAGPYIWLIAIRKAGEVFA